MKVVFDIETNSLTNPTKIWCIVCKDIDTGKHHIFRNLTEDGQQRSSFCKFATGVDRFIGHNVLGYDCPVLRKLGIIDIDHRNVIDTLIISKLANYSREGGHSIEQYGTEFGLEKLDIGKAIAGHNPFFNQWSQKLEDYCVRDVDVCHRIYLQYLHIISDPAWASAIDLEQAFQCELNHIHDTGFGLDRAGALSLLEFVNSELAFLDSKILTAFPPREVLIREFTPKLTKFGTISKSSVPRALQNQIHMYEAGKTYRHTKLEPFNPASHKQLIEVLNEAGWKPEDKTQTHIDAIRTKDTDKLTKLKITGWKINEHNLGTLPPNAPEPSRLLARRILLESRRRTLTEWLGLLGKDCRIHGDFYGIGAWTHRMAHQKPNTANIPREFKEDGSLKLLGKEMRSLWCAPSDRLLVGVDAEGIQLRIFAHYIDDEEFTHALVQGKKADKTDPHSLNQRILGNACKTRQAAKRFIYALLLGGGLSKLAEILGCSSDEARKALDRLMGRYTGFKRLKKTTIPKDAARGYFVGLDGRQVQIPGETKRDREHLCMSGYLQNGEAIIIKRAAVITAERLAEEKKKKLWSFVDIVHDELQSEVNKNMSLALKVAQIKADAIREAGEYYKLKCPMAGSFVNDDTKQLTIGQNWYETH